jgi:ZIP family zinc transporter
MATESIARGGVRRSVLALIPIVLLVGIVSAFLATGGSLVGLIGQNPPQPDVFDIRRVEFDPGEIRIKVTNPQTDDLTIASVTVDDAIVPFSLDGPATLKRLRSATIHVNYDWVEDEPLAVGVTSSTRPPAPPPRASSATGSSVFWSGSCRSRSGSCGCRRCAACRRRGCRRSWR